MTQIEVPGDIFDRVVNAHSIVVWELSTGQKVAAQQGIVILRKETIPDEPGVPEEP